MLQKSALSTLLFCILLHAATMIVPLPELNSNVQKAGDQTSFDGTCGGAVGAPSLPFEKIKLLLPPTADVNSVNVRVLNPIYEDLIGTYDISPTPPMMLQGKELIPEGVSLVAGKDLSAYEKSVFLPETPLSSIIAGNYRSFKTVSFLLSPFRYNAAEQRLQKLIDGEIQISYSEVRSTAVAEIPYAYGKISKSCINSDLLLEQYPSKSRNKTTYLIATTSNIQTQLLKLDEFIATKEGKGFNVEVITESDFGSGPDQLRSWLQDNYTQKSIEYLLIIGTPDPQGGDIPMKVMYPMKLSEIGQENYRDVPSDQYFAELTGNWDLNGNGVFGEGGDCGSGGALSDTEIKVGRLPFSSAQTIDEVLQKSMEYETADEGSIAWRKNMFQSVVKYDDQTSGDPMMDGIKALASGWNTKKLSQGQCSESAVTNEWNSGTYGYKVWLTHGLWNMAQHIINSSYAKTLKKDNPCFVIMGSCLNARPRDGNLSATILTTAGIGCLAATQVSLYRPGEIYKEDQWYNQALLYHFSRLLIVEELPIGDIVATMQSDLSIDYPGASYNWWHNWPNFTIYGDPALAITSCGAVEAETIEVTAPSEGDEWQQGSEVTINWSTTCSDDTELTITIHKNNDSTRVATVSAVDKTCNWTVPLTVSKGAGYKIHIQKSSDNTVFGESGAFTITEADNTEYTLTVEDGSGSGSYRAGTLVDISADDAESGYMFDEWTGTGSSSVSGINSATTTLTMPARDVSVKATYTKIPPSSGNLVLLNKWENEGCELSNSSFDSSNVKSDTLVSMEMTIGKAPDATTYPWCKVSTYLDGDFSNTTRIRIKYKSADKYLLELPQDELAAKGTSFFSTLPASSSWTEKTIEVNEDNFSQPDWVEEASSLILADLLGVSIVPTTAAEQKSSIEIKELIIYGYEPAEQTLSIAQNGARVFDVVNVGKELQLAFPQQGQYTLSIYSTSGRALFQKKLNTPAGIYRVSLAPIALSQQMIIINLHGESRKVTKKMLLQ